MNSQHRQKLPSNLLERATIEARNILYDFAIGQNFSTALKLVFGDRIETSRLKQSWKAKEFNFPKVEVLDRFNSGFEPDANKIYLERKFLVANKNNLEAITDAFLAEYGRYLERQFNINHAFGDRGAVFAATVGETKPNRSISAINEPDKAIEQDTNTSIAKSISLSQTDETQPSTRQIDLPTYDDGSIVSNTLIGDHSINGDGRYLVFTSSASSLVDGDNNGADDIFVRDLVDSTTQIVSLTSDDALATNSFFFNTNLNTEPDISSNGRYVVFKSSADNLYPNDDNYAEDLFVRDLVDSTTQIVNISSDGVVSNYAPYGSAVSDSGSVVFESFADNLVANDNNDVRDIFVRDLIEQTTQLVSLSSNHSLANDYSYNPDISSDGRYVVFESFADNLVANDNNDVRDIFVRDLIEQTTQLVSLSSNDSLANDYSYNPDISSDGRYVVFESFADNLVANDNNDVRDIFVRDLIEQTTQLVSLSSDGSSSGRSESSNSKISGDGRYVVFESSADNLVAETQNNATSIYVRDLKNNTTKQLELENDFSASLPSPIRNLDLSFDGRYITFDAGDNIYLHDRGTSFADSRATVEITSVTQNPNNNEAIVNYDLVNADSQTQIKLFYDDDNRDFDGVLITDALSQSDNSFVWNTKDILPGNYYLYTAIEDENNSSFNYWTQSIEIIASDRPPRVANPLADLEVNENTGSHIIDLSQVFSDEDGDEIAITIRSNSNPQLFSSSIDGSNLLLDFAPDLYGTGEITLEATANNLKVLDTFKIKVNRVDVAPTSNDRNEPELSLADVHRFYQYNRGFHFYTADANEINDIREKSSAGELSYSYEAEKYRVLTDDRDLLTGETIERVEPIYRFFNNSTGAHLYTMDENEKNQIQNNLSNYSFEGIKYYAFETAPEDIETISVYRMLNTQSGAHLFTSDRNELNHIQENLPHFSMENNGNAVFHVIDL